MFNGTGMQLVNLPLALSLSALLVSLIFGLVWLISCRRHKVLLKRLTQQLQGFETELQSKQAAVKVQRNKMEAQVQKLKEQLLELAKKQSAWGVQQQSIEQQFSQFVERQVQFEKALVKQKSDLQALANQDPEVKFYQKAARLVQQGATLEEIMEACDLPLAEAELLISLYKTKS